MTRVLRKGNTVDGSFRDAGVAQQMISAAERVPRQIGDTGYALEVPVVLSGPGAEQRIPKVAPYRFRSDLVEDLCVGVREGMNILLVGPAGCGKTSLPIQVAASIGMPCVRFNLNGETRVAHLRGQQRPAAVDGVLTLEFSIGALVEAMRHGWWVILDEIDAAPPPVLFVLQPVLEEGNRSIDIPETGERVVADETFAVFATGNTIGFRSRARSRHAGTNPMNTALIDRFGMLISVDYPTRAEENKILHLYVPELAATDEGRAILDGVCRVAEKLRIDDKFRSDFSTRRCIQWARLIAQFPIENNKAKKMLPWDVIRAARLSVLRKLESPTDTKVAFEVTCRTFDYQDELKKAVDEQKAATASAGVKA